MSHHPSTRAERRHYNFIHRGSDCSSALKNGHGYHNGRPVDRGVGNDLDYGSPRRLKLDRSDSKVREKIGDVFAHLSRLNEYYYEHEFEFDYGNAEPIFYCEYCRGAHPEEQLVDWNPGRSGWSDEEFDDDHSYWDWFWAYSHCPIGEQRHNAAYDRLLLSAADIITGDWEDDIVPLGTNTSRAYGAWLQSYYNEASDEDVPGFIYGDYNYENVTDGYYD